jgi:type VI secretion system protein VasJ
VVQPQSATQAAELVIRAATWMRKEDARRAAAYRLVRSLRWDALTGEPPNDRRKTAIEAPPAARREYLLGLQKRDAWEDLLREAEASFAQPPFHFWLDLQRLIVAALDGMGAEYALARDVVVRDVQLLTTRLPGLTTLLFADGRTRFADPATVTWLESIAKPTSTTPPNARDAATSPRTSGGLASRFAEPRKRFNDGDLAGALALLQRGRGDDASQHDRFLRRLYAAMLCLEAGQLPVAKALLEELDEAIELHRLEQWDPKLALDVWTRLYTCYAAQATRVARGGDVQQLGRDMQRVFARICRVDTARALAATQEAGHPKQ